MITTVTLNPAIDKIVEINQMSLGHVHRVKNMVKTLGGKSINVARILTGLEIDTVAVCFAGKNNLDEVITHAQRDAIVLNPIVVDGSTRTNVKITEPDQDYRTTDINEPGFVISPDKLETMTQTILEYAQKSTYVILSGSIPDGVPPTYYKMLAQLLKPTTRVVIDADNEILASAIEGSPFLIKPNIHELESAVGVFLKTQEDIIRVCKQIIQQHSIQYILVSMGEKGSLLISKDYSLKADILPVKVVSTVGAGDSMLGGFIYGLIECETDSKLVQLGEEQRLLKALSYGVASSSIAISTKDHVSFKKDVLIQHAAEVMIQKL